jgi:signal peptidase I
MSLSATPPAELGTSLAARRSPEQLQASKRLLWQERLTSQWTPLLILLVAFVPYLFLIEFLPGSASWAQPFMQYLALAMLLYFVGLGLWRLATPKQRPLRRRRHEAREQLADTERLLRRVSGKVHTEAFERVADQALRVEAASLAGDVPVLEKEMKELEAVTKKHLSAFRGQANWEAASGFIKLLLVALVVRVVIIEPYRIPSGSMLPTLEIGDQVFINKFIYGVRLPFTNWVPFQIIRAPAAGDVIVFENPVDASKDFIKRVVGVPGDKVELKEGVVYLNGVAQERVLVDDDRVVHNLADIYTPPKNRNEEPIITRRWEEQHMHLYRETLGSHAHAVLQNGPRSRASYEGPFIVPEGHVFVMGDNRENSLDSRYGLGGGRDLPEYVPYGHIKGKAMVVWMALGYGGWLSNLFGGTGLRTDRLFEPVR